MLAILAAFLGGVALPVGVIAFAATHPDETQKWLAYFFDLISKIWKGFQYQAIKFDLQSRINSFVSTLNSNSATSFPKVSIKWAGRDNEEVIWEEGRVLLVMRDKKNRTKNLVHASHLFVSETLLKRSKVHLSKSQKTSVDLFATKLILEKESPAALEYFVSGYLVPELAKRDRVSDFLKQFVAIDKMGAFFPILIQELTFLGNTIYLEKPSAEIVKEVNDLINFLEAFSLRHIGDTTTQETFTGRYIRCAIRIIATRAVREAGKVEGRRQLITAWLQRGYPNIYIIGSNNEDNRIFMEDVITAVQGTYPDLEVIKTYECHAEITLANGDTKVVPNVITHLHHPRAVKHILSEREL